jgi:hypothetical protein
MEALRFVVTEKSTKKGKLIAGAFPAYLCDEPTLTVLSGLAEPGRAFPDG